MRRREGKLHLPAACRSPWKGRVHRHVDSAGFGCSLGPRAVLTPAKGPLGRASGGVSTALLLLHFATSTSSKPPSLGKRPTPQKATFVPLTSFSCPSVTSGNGTGRGGTRAGRQRAAIIPQTQLQILYLAKKLSCRDSARGKRCPLDAQRAAEKAGLEDFVRKSARTDLQQGKFLGSFLCCQFSRSRRCA